MTDIFYKNREAIIVILGLVVLGSVVFCGRVFLYNDTITHPSLTGNIANIYNANFEKKLSQQEINWLKQGSIEEDTAPRWLNHFYEPNTGQGLWGNLSSKEWAQDQLVQNSYFLSKGNQTWQKAIDSYISGKNQEAFIALGHILHLLEDATVPAHTRLDAHIEGDPYEVWVVEKIGSEMSFSVSPANIGNLSEAFYTLADYSNRYFFSKDTIPSGDYLANQKRFNIFIEGKTYDCVKGEQNQCLVLVKEDISGYVYYLDVPVHSDYFSLLAPKAVAYGAGVIKLFFDEAEKKKKEEEGKNWWQKLKEKTNDWLASVSGSLYAGLGPVALQNNNTAPSEAAPSGASEAPEAISPISLSLNTIKAGEKVGAQLPPNTVVALEKLGGNIIEETNPQEKEIPSAIIEEINPSQVKLPSPSPTSTPNPFIPGASGPSPSPSPSSGPDTSPPETTITAKPASSVATTTAIFEFESTENGSLYSCQLDNATSTSCLSPKEYTGLSEGSHTFKVSATDAAGNQDLTPAEYSWVVDVSAPQLSNISSNPGRSSALISWTSSEAGIFQIEYGASTNYGLASATTSAANLTLNSLLINTTYHFRILAQDSLNNSTSSADNSFTTTSQAENVIISEIQISGATADDEFVELYNPTTSDIDLTGWKLARRTATATSSYSYNLLTSFPNKIIPAHSYFLVAHPTDYDGGVPSDAVYSSASYYIASDNAVILFSDNGHTIIDMVGFGAAASSENATIANSASHQSVERKSVSTSTAAVLFSGEHKWSGNGYDSDNNSQDFVIQDNPSPQNSLMLTEPRNSLPSLMTTSAWPTWQKNLARTGQLAVASLATSTMAAKWAATTTVTHEFLSRPMLDDEGNIYIGRADGLAKYSSSGNLVWLYSTSTAYAVPLTTSDNTIFFRGVWGLYAINKNGQTKWKYPLSGSAGSNAVLAILSDGTIITQSAEKVYAINQDATLKWVFDPGRAIASSNSISAFVVDSLDNVYVAIDNYIYAISSVGSLLWEKNLGSGYSSLALSSGNILYVSLKTVWPQGGFYALDADNGSIIWANENGYNNLAYLSPVIDSSGQVYNILFTGGGARNFQSYNATSTPNWTVNLGSVWLAAPIITSDNKIYVADQKTIKIFDASDGSLVYTFNSPNDDNLDTYFGAVGPDGAIYTANSTRLYAIGS